MPTAKPRVTFAISKDRLEELEAYRYGHQMKNQTQAILSLLEKGLSQCEGTIKKASSLSDEARRLAADYDILDSHGQKAVRAVADIEQARCESEKVLRLAQSQQQRGEDGTAPTESTGRDVIYYTLPEYIQKASAGTGDLALDDAKEDLLFTKRPPKGSSYVVSINGDSMEPTYHHGDRLFVHAAVEIEPGQIGVYYMDGKMWVKELGEGVLISHNPAYGPIPLTEDVQCQGQVLGLCDESYFE